MVFIRPVRRVRPVRLLFFLLFLLHLPDNLHRLHADGTDPPDKVDDLFLMIRESVGIELLRDGRVFRFPLLILLQNPLDGRPVPQPILPRLRHRPPKPFLGLDSRRCPLRFATGIDSHINFRKIDRKWSFRWNPELISIFGCMNNNINEAKHPAMRQYEDAVVSYL